MLRTRIIVWLVVACAAAVTFGASACGNGAEGVDACRSIEDARCQRASACQISLQQPYHTSGSDVDACIRYYQVACLHGLAVGDPGTASVNACVAAIENGDCSLVQNPTTGACAWLAPSAASSSATEPAEAGVELDGDDADLPDGEAGAD